MEKRRLSLNRSGGAKNYNSPLKGGPYSAHPVHYNMIENIHLDLDAMDNEIDKALNSTSTKVRQVTHNFTVLQSIYFNTDTRKWVLAQADDKDTIGTHIVVEVITKDYFVAGLSGTFEVRNTLDLGYWFTSDTVAGELVDTAPDINNPMIQVIDSNSIRVLDIGIVDNLDSIHINATADAHKSSAISHGSGSVEDRLDNITDGVITRDANDDILSMMTFGETTVFNRDVNGEIESWENDTHVWTLMKTNGEIIGWTLTEKP